MKYYCIQNSLERKVIGHYPQVKEVIYSCDVDNEPRFIEHVNYKKIDFEPIVANAVLYSSSKLTDLIHSGGVGFSLKLLVSTKLKSILEKFRLTGLQFFKDPLIYRGNEEDYWILNFYEVDMQFIDYPNSDIYITKNVFDYVEKLSLNSFLEFNDVMSKINHLGFPMGVMIERYTLIDTIDQDFFILLNVWGGINYVVSERLKQEMESAGCTGIVFRPSEANLRYWRE
jgi:hypothetical protein